MINDKFLWSAKTSPEIAVALASKHLVVLPVAATEQHGPHLPLSTDTDILEGIVSHGLSLCSDQPILVLPTQTVGLSPEHMGFAGSLSLTAHASLESWFSILHSAQQAGAKRFLILNGHGGQISICDLLAGRVRQELGAQAIWSHVDALGLPKNLISDQERRVGIHAGQVETALMMALQPNRVRLDKRADFASRREALTQNNSQLRSGGAARYAWMAEDLNQSGAVGAAHKASKEQGVAILNHRAKSLALLFKEVLELPL